MYFSRDELKRVHPLGYTMHQLYEDDHYGRSWLLIIPSLSFQRRSFRVYIPASGARLHLFGIAVAERFQSVIQSWLPAIRCHAGYKSHNNRFIRYTPLTIDRTYLQVVLPRHVSVGMGFAATIDRSRLLLRRRSRIIVIVSGCSLPVIHLDRIRLGRRCDGGCFDGRHQWLGRHTGSSSHHHHRAQQQAGGRGRRSKRRTGSDRGKSRRQRGTDEKGKQTK